MAKKEKKDRKEKKSKKERKEKKRKRDPSDSDEDRGQKRLAQEVGLQLLHSPHLPYLQQGASAQL